MITPQYTYDNTGNRIGVFLPIDDWNQLIQIPGVDELAYSDFSVPEWHKELGVQELQNVANGTADLMSWDEAKKQFKL